MEAALSDEALGQFRFRPGGPAAPLRPVPPAVRRALRFSAFKARSRVEPGSERPVYLAARSSVRDASDGDRRARVLPVVARDGRERAAASLFEYVHMILAAACDVYRDIARRRPGDVYRAWHGDRVMDALLQALRAPRHLVPLFVDLGEGKGQGPCPST